MSDSLQVDIVSLLNDNTVDLSQLSAPMSQDIWIRRVGSIIATNQSQHHGMVVDTSIDTFHHHEVGMEGKVLNAIQALAIMSSTLWDVR